MNMLMGYLLGEPCFFFTNNVDTQGCSSTKDPMANWLEVILSQLPFDDKQQLLLLSLAADGGPRFQGGIFCIASHGKTALRMKHYFPAWA